MLPHGARAGPPLPRIARCCVRRTTAQKGIS